MPADAGDLWILITVVGVVILGAAIAYGMWKSSKTTPRQEAMRDAATRAQYQEDSPDLAAAPNEPARREETAP